MVTISRGSPRFASVALSALMLAAGCDATVAPSATLARPTAPIEASAWAVALCQASDQLSLGLVDPRTGQTSAAWIEFERAAAGGDEAEIDAAANAVLGHLGQAARSANEALAFEPGSEAAIAWWDMIDGLMGAVRSLRDGTVAQDAGRVNDARTALEQAVEVSLPAAVAAMGAVDLAGERLPCG